MNKLSHLKSLGYNETFENKRLELKADIECLARVTAEHKGVYEIISLRGESRATVTGKRMQSAFSRDDYPAVGDWVVVKESADDEKVIEHILPRQTSLRKKYGGKDASQLMVANVEVVFIVESVDRDFNINRLERYLVLAREGGVKPVIVLNKTDLLAENYLAARIEELQKRFSDVDILQSNTLSDEGVYNIARYIQPYTTYCFVGSSGVGKSSVINKLIDKNIETKAIGDKSGRGRHTTTSRQMYLTNDGGIIIDNPGSREVGLVNFSSGASEVFSDIKELSSRCKYRDCSHNNEQGCAVLGAIKSGDIEPARYENYLRLQKETEHYEMSSYDKRTKDKKFGKFIKNAKSDLKKYKSK
jgi:ribosome biogenesis GTPase